MNEPSPHKTTWWLRLRAVLRRGLWVFVRTLPRNLIYVIVGIVCFLAAYLGVPWISTLFSLR